MPITKYERTIKEGDQHLSNDDQLYAAYQYQSDFFNTTNIEQFLIDFKRSNPTEIAKGKVYSIFYDALKDACIDDNERELCRLLEKSRKWESLSDDEKKELEKNVSTAEGSTFNVMMHRITKKQYLFDFFKNKTIPQALQDFRDSNPSELKKERLYTIFRDLLKDNAENEDEKKLCELLIKKQSYDKLSNEEKQAIEDAITGGNADVFMTMLQRVMNKTENKKELLDLKKLSAFHQGGGSALIRALKADADALFPVETKISFDFLPQKDEACLSYLSVCTPFFNEIGSPIEALNVAKKNGIEIDFSYSGKEEREFFNSAEYRITIKERDLFVKAKKTENNEREINYQLPLFVAETQIKNTFGNEENEQKMCFSIEGETEKLDQTKLSHNFDYVIVNKPEQPVAPSTVLSRTASILSGAAKILKGFLPLGERNKNAIEPQSPVVQQRPDSLSPANSASPVSFAPYSPRSCATPSSGYNPPIVTLGDGNCGFNAMALYLLNDVTNTVNDRELSHLIDELKKSTKDNEGLQKEFGPKIRAYACKAYTGYIESMNEIPTIRKTHTKLYAYVKDALEKLDNSIKGYQELLSVPGLTPEEIANANKSIENLKVEKQNLIKKYPEPKVHKQDPSRSRRTPEELQASKLRHKKRMNDLIQDFVGDPKVWVDDSTLNVAAASLGCALEVAVDGKTPYPVKDADIEKHFKVPQDAPVITVKNTGKNHWEYLPNTSVSPVMTRP